jgi:hypothetical protein
VKDVVFCELDLVGRLPTVVVEAAGVAIPHPRKTKMKEVLSLRDSTQSINFIFGKRMRTQQRFYVG